ncbi:hypothetical protein ACIBL6_08870 [Streptomyces sp. NPDC050400]|uniref:hypothetical protein n=1 Tax=Streptomyces sp. NPDC050400 TaxID=3365610 RepID=UPI00378D0499
MARRLLTLLAALPPALGPGRPTASAAGFADPVKSAPGGGLTGPSGEPSSTSTTCTVTNRAGADLRHRSRLNNNCRRWKLNPV